MGSMLGLPEYMRTLSSYDHILSALEAVCLALGVRDRSLEYVWQLTYMAALNFDFRHALP